MAQTGMTSWPKVVSAVTAVVVRNFEPRSEMDELSILVVEDEEAAREIIVSVLDLKYPSAVINSAKNGKIGVELFKRYMPDIVITDINMPAQDGIQMAAEIRSIKADTQFVVLTAHNDKGYLDHTAENKIKIHHFIMKPIDYDQFFAAIDQCIAEIPACP